MGKGPYCDLFTKRAQHVKKDFAFLADAFARGGGAEPPAAAKKSKLLSQKKYIYIQVFFL